MMLLNFKDVEELRLIKDAELALKVIKEINYYDTSEQKD